MVIPVTQPFPPSLASSNYGQRPRGDYHLGRDYATAKGTPVRATQAGRVSRVGGSRKHIWGFFLHVDSGDGHEQEYHVLDRYPTLKVGDRVALGQVIAYTGDTDNYFPHMHYGDKRGSFYHNPALLPYSEAAFSGKATAFNNSAPVVKKQIGDEMIVYANKDTNVWARGVPLGGKWHGIPAGQGDAYVKISGRDRIVLSDAEFMLARDACLDGVQTDTHVYADTGSNVWWLLGPGVEYQIPEGEGALWEGLHGRRIAMSSEDVARVREGYAQTGGTASFDFDGIRKAIEAAAGTIAKATNDDAARRLKS